MTSLVSTAAPPGPAVVARAQAGDHAAFEAIFNQLQTPIFNYLYRLTSDADDAHDMTQDTFLKAWLSLTNPASSAHRDPALRVVGWLYRIATNVCVDEMRHRKLVTWQPWDIFLAAFHPDQVARDNPEREVLDRELQAEVRDVLGRLSAPEVRVIALSAYHDLSYDEMAARLGTTRAAIKSLLFRARRKFESRWKVREQRGQEGAA